MERDKRRPTHQLPIGLCRGRLIALAGGAALLLLLTAGALSAAETPFNGLDMSLSNLARLSDARTRSISPENFTGEKGKGGMATEGTDATLAVRSFVLVYIFQRRFLDRVVVRQLGGDKHRTHRQEGTLDILAADLFTLRVPAAARAWA